MERKWKEINAVNTNKMDKEKLIAACTEVLAQNEEASSIIIFDQTEGLRYDISRGHEMGQIVVEIREN